MSRLVFKAKNNSIEDTNQFFENALLNQIKTLVVRNTFLPLFDKYTFNEKEDIEVLYNDFLKNNGKSYYMLLNVLYVTYNNELYGYIFIDNPRIQELFDKLEGIDLISEENFIYEEIIISVKKNYYAGNGMNIHSFKILEEPLSFNEFYYILNKENISENKIIRLKLLARYFVNKEIKEAKPSVNKFSLAMDFLSKYEDYQEIDFIENYPETYKNFEYYLTNFLKNKVK